MAKRVNKKFLIILTGTFVGLGVVAFGASKVLQLRKDPQKHVEEARRLAKEGRFEDALERMKWAVAADRNNKEVLVEYGDLLDSRTGENIEYLGQSRSLWQAALVVDPKYVPALQRLLDSYWEQLEIAPYNELYGEIRETAGKLMTADPANPTAEQRLHLATLRPWLAEQPVRQQDVDASLKRLSELSLRDSSNAEISLHLARAKMRQAFDAKRKGQAAEAPQLYAAAAGIMNVATKGQEKNAAMQLRAYQVYRTLDELERADKSREGDAAAASQDLAKGRYFPKAQQALAAAVAAAGPEHPLYPEIHREAAELALRQKNNEQAEKIYDDLLATRPDDQRVRLGFVRLLSRIPAKRDKAIAILSRPVTSAQTLSGARAIEVRELEGQTLLELTNRLVEQFRATPEPARRAEILADINKHYQKLKTLAPGDNIALLRLEGRKRQLEGDLDGAIQSLARAVTLMGESSGKDYDLLNELAVAYLQVGQTGQARRLLTDITSRFKTHVPSKVQLAQLLLNDNKLPEALAELQAVRALLSKLPPESEDLARYGPQVDRLTLLVKNQQKDPAAEKGFAALPEKTREEKLAKAQMARGLKNTAEAIRLAESLVQADPKDMAALELLINALTASEENDRALDVVNKALETNPDNKGLQEARQRLESANTLEGATAQQTYEHVKQGILKEPESLGRNLRLADLERRYGRIAEAEKLLKAAEVSNAKDLNVIARLYDLYVASRRFEQAEPYHRALLAARTDEGDRLMLEFRFALARGDNAKALEFGRNLSLKRQEFAQSFVAYGQALQANGRYAEAVRQYDAARQRQGRNYDALKNTVDCYYALNQPEDAARVIEEARGLFPDDPTFRELSLNHQATYGDPEPVIAAREQLRKEKPEQPNYWLASATAYLRTAQTKYPGEAAKKARLENGAKALLVEALKKWPDDRRFHSALAETLGASKDIEGGAKVLLDYAAREDMKDKPEPQLMLADYYARTNKPEEAEKSLRDALAKSGNSPEVRQRLVNFLAGVRKFDEAFAALDEAGEDPRFSRLRLDLQIRAGRRDDAEKGLLAALDKSPNAPDLKMMLASLYLDSGRHDKALARVSEIIQADAKNPNLQAVYYRAVIKLRQPRQDVDGAIADLLTVRKAHPGDVQTRLLLASALRSKGSTEQAARELQEGLGAAPLSKDLRIGLMDLLSADRARLPDVVRLAQDARKDPRLATDPTWAYRESQARAALGELDKAAVAITDAIKLAPQNPTLIREYHNLLLRAKDYKGLLKVTDALPPETKAAWWVRQNRGVAKAALKDVEGAMAEFDAALAAVDELKDASAAEAIVRSMSVAVGLDEAIARVLPRVETDPRWRLVAGVLYTVKKDWPAALGMADAVLATLDTLPKERQEVALRTVAPIYHVSDPPHIDKARDAYLQLLKLAPNDYLALNNLAALLSEDVTPPQPQEARSYSQRAYDLVKNLRPAPPRVLDTHGWVLVLCNELDPAIDLLKIVAKDAQFPEARYHLGVAYLRKSMSAEALQEMTGAADMIRQSLAKTEVDDRGLLELQEKVDTALAQVRDLMRVQGGEADAR